MSDPFDPSSWPIRNLATRAREWQLRTRKLVFPRLPLWMGIVNVTPDSFSDGGAHDDAEAAVRYAMELVEQGADVLDIGGESTRPYSQPVDAQQELRRVMPVVERLAAETKVPLSIDTSKAAVAREALAAGAEIINDVTGLTGDPQMLPLAVESGAAVCAMHMRGTPQTMQDDLEYDDLVGEIHHYLQQRRDALLAAGAQPARICLDPGIGFGKSHAQNLALLAASGQFHDLGCPLLVGHSRKAFLGKIVGSGDADRGAATVGASVALARAGVQVIRVHQVRPSREAVLAFAATGGLA